jgi:hypothetical protein
VSKEEEEEAQAGVEAKEAERHAPSLSTTSPSN